MTYAYKIMKLFVIAWINNYKAARKQEKAIQAANKIWKQGIEEGWIKCSWTVRRE